MITTYVVTWWQENNNGLVQFYKPDLEWGQVMSLIDSLHEVGATSIHVDLEDK